MNRSVQVLTAACLTLAGLSAALRPLAEPDEGRYGEAAREMVATGDWVLPKQSGVTYPDKPVGGYWLMAGSMTVLGAVPLAVRLPALAAFAALLLLIFRQARRGPPGHAETALLVAATCPLLLALGQLATLDMILSTCVAAAILAGRKWTGSRNRRAGLLAGAALGAAFLVKGPVGPLLAISIQATTLVWEGRARLALRLLHPLHLLPMLAVGLPWYALAAARDPDLVDFWLFRETLGRVASDVHGRGRPGYYFPALTVAALLPWLVGAAFARVRGRAPDAGDRHPDHRLHRVWALLPVVFFSIPAGKQPAYLAPAMAGFALWLADWWRPGSAVAPGAAGRPFATAAGGIAALLLFAGGVAAVLFARDPEYARSDDRFAATLQAENADAWPGAQLYGWSYGLTFRLQRTDLVACGPIPPAWRYARQTGALRMPSTREERFAAALEVLDRGEPVFVLLHQLEEDPENLVLFPAAARAAGIELWLWLRSDDAALLANQPPAAGGAPLR
ncbi:MAG TPA: glycosyltransferase family 39 protein [Planctomycetota bacterium]